MDLGSSWLPAFVGLDRSTLGRGVPAQWLPPGEARANLLPPMTDPSPPPVRPEPAASAPTPGAALAFVLALAVLFLPGALLTTVLLGEAGLMVAEWLFLFLPALLFLRAGGWSPRRVLSLRVPPAGAVGGGLLLVAGALPVAWFLAWAQASLFPVPPEVLEGMERMLAADSPGRVLWLLLAVALTPAVCEEVVFRGVLLGATRHLAPWRFLLLNGLVFGAFHLSVETAVRFLPTAWLGIVIAWAVWRTGSLAVGVLMHAANNGTIVLAAAMPVATETPPDPAAPPPLWLAPVAMLALAAGARRIVDADPDRPLSRDPQDPESEVR